MTIGRLESYSSGLCNIHVDEILASGDKQVCEFTNTATDTILPTSREAVNPPSPVFLYQFKNVSETVRAPKLVLIDGNMDILSCGLAQLNH